MKSSRRLPWTQARQHVLKTKRICLRKYLLETTSFPDMGVVDLVKDGIPLYGVHSKPPNFVVDWRPAALSVTELLDSSIWRRKILMGTPHRDQRHSN